MVWTLLCVATNIDVREIKHIPGHENEKCDRLSRRGVSPVGTVRNEAEEMGIEGGVVIEINEDEEIMGLLRLCDPRRELESDSDFVAFWTEVRDAVTTFVDRHVPHSPVPSTNPNPHRCYSFASTLSFPYSPQVWQTQGQYDTLHQKSGLARRLP